MKRDSPFRHTLFSTHSNVCTGSGHIPTGHGYEQGGFEVKINTPFGPEAARQGVEASLALLREIAGRRGQPQSGGLHAL